MPEGWRHSGQGGDWMGGAKLDLISRQGSGRRKSVLTESASSRRCSGGVSLLLLFPAVLCIAICFLWGDGETQLAGRAGCSF